VVSKVVQKVWEYSGSVWSVSDSVPHGYGHLWKVPEGSRDFPKCCRMVQNILGTLGGFERGMPIGHHGPWLHGPHLGRRIEGGKSPHSGHLTLVGLGGRCPDGLRLNPQVGWDG
jgi:hypothetical protein